MTTKQKKTSELTGAALDWAVAKCEGGDIRTEHGVFLNQGDGYDYYTPSTDWAQGGPIIERKGMHISRIGDYLGFDGWVSSITVWTRDSEGLNPHMSELGPTPLIAAMRCYVASKLGDEIEIPTELL